MNPRAAINDLLPFQGSPFGQLGYFSKMPAYYTRYTFLTHSSFVIICLNLLSCACAPSRKTKGSPFNSELPKRRGWDSNPRALSDKRFSRPPRYDHFDTSPTIYLSAASVSPQRQDVFYHSFLLSSILFLNFFIFLYFSYFSVFFVYKYSSLQRLIHRLRSAFYMLNKSFCRIQIFRCRNLNITVRTFI